MAKRIRQTGGAKSWNSGGGSPFQRKPRGKIEIGGKQVFTNTTRDRSKQQINYPVAPAE